MKHKATTISILELFARFSTDYKAIKWLENTLWGSKPMCGHCGNTEGITPVKSSKQRNYRCKACRNQFNVKTNTMMQASNIPARKWVIAIYLVMTSRKGISSLQLSKELGITQKSSWFMVQRIRETFAKTNFKLNTIVEVDEAYFGGKEANKHESKKLHSGRGVANKQAVVGIRQRNGNAIAMPVDSTNRETLQGFITDNVEAGSTVYTDDHRSYIGLGSRNDYRHGVVKHSVAEYVNGQAHTNGIESMRAVLKRGYHGTYHHLSAKHLHRYVNEFSYRLSDKANCQVDTMDRMEAVANNLSDTRLTYKELTQ